MPRRLLNLVACLLIATLVHSPAWAQDDDDSVSEPAAPPPRVRVEAPPPPDPDALWAHARQVTLPAWSARTESALARVEAARGYFAGDEAIGVAFPDLAAGPHHSTAWLSAGLLAITGRETDRLRERARPVPPFGDARRAARWTSARSAALDAEDLADAQARRLLLALQAVAADHPDLAGAGYAAERARLVSRAGELEQRWDRSEEGPARDALARELATAHAEIERLDTQARAARRWAAVPGAPGPSPDGDLERLAGQEAHAAAARLERLLVVLGPTDRHRVETALVAWLQDEALPAATAALDAARAAERAAESSPLPSLWTLQRRALSATQAASRADEGLAALQGDGPLQTLRRSVLEAEQEAARHELATTSTLLARLQRLAKTSTSKVEANAAAERAESARREAERAAKEANDARGRRIAGLLEEVAVVESEAQKAWDAVNAREAVLTEDVEVWQKRLQGVEAEVEAIRDLPPGLGGQRRTRSSDAWTQLHDQLTTLRKGAISAGASWSEAETDRVDVRRGIAESQATLAEGRTFGRSLPEGDLRSNLESALEQWDKALQSRADAADHLVDIEAAHRESVLELLQDEKGLRDRLRSHVPDSVIARDREVLFQDLQLELSLVVPNLGSLAKRRLASLTSLPRLFQQLDRLWALIVGSFWLFLAVVVWFWGRARVGEAVPPVVSRLQVRRAQLFTRSFDALHEPLTRVARATVDLVAVALLLDPIRDRLPELALVLVLYRLVALYRLGDGLFRLAVAPLEDNRPALLALRGPAWTLAVRATRVLLLWLILGNFVQYICRDLLGADALGQVLGTAFSLAFLVLAIILLFQAEPPLRAAVREAPESGLQSWLANPPSNPLVTRALRGLLSLLLLVGVRLWQLLQGNVDETSALGSILNVVNRRWLATRTGGEAPVPVSPRIARRIDNQAARDEIATLYPRLDARFSEAFTGWKEDNARGLVLLVGDRGQGKQVWANRTLDRLGDDAPAILRARLSLRLVKPGHLFGYLAREWGLGNLSSADEFERAIKKRPPTVFLIEEIEFAFLRRVGGFAALRALFRVVTATSAEHFWLLTVHAPAWRLLERVGTVANPNSFRAVLEIPRLTGSELGPYLGLRTTSAGFRPDFSALSSSTPVGQPAAERERTAEAFFRLLAEASGGNPGVAVPLWTMSLCPTDDKVLTTGEFRGLDDHEVKPAELPRLLVRLPDEIASPTLPPLTDAALLTLAAVRVHGFLNVQEIVQANNMEPDLVRTTAQVLESLGLLQRVDGRYRIAMKHLPAVTRLLRRRHFVYGKDQP